MINNKKEILSFTSWLLQETFPGGKELTEEEVENYFDKYISLQLQGQVNDTCTVEEWIEEWFNLFPKGVKSSSGKLIRTKDKDLAKRMKSFIKDYGYSKEIIFNATREYLREQEEKDYKYCRASSYFIGKKGEGSDLASYCEKHVDGEFNEVLTDEMVIPSNNFL
jgi:hypothetical protein